MTQTSGDCIHSRTEEIAVHVGMQTFYIVLQIYVQKLNTFFLILILHVLINTSLYTLSALLCSVRAQIAHLNDDTYKWFIYLWYWFCL
jgi:hypothetical protein